MVDFIKPKANSIDLTGQIFSRLTVLGPVGRHKSGKILWLCQCSCGNIVEVKTDNLKLRKVMSCGCLSIERISNLRKTHGLSRTRIYRVWAGMINRCVDPNNGSYSRYGGKGVGVCLEWQHSFDSFYAHVSILPFFNLSGYTIDRIDNSKGYFPGNVRWVTMAQQCRNKSNNVNLTYQGKTQCIEDWSKELGIAAPTLLKRFRSGWSTEKTLSTPVRKQKNNTKA